MPRKMAMPVTFCSAAMAAADGPSGLGEPYSADPPFWERLNAILSIQWWQVDHSANRKQGGSFRKMDEDGGVAETNNELDLGGFPKILNLKRRWR